ncbi:MAG TPA: HAMP domain-containing sensor histidine kinase, partial [Terriglobales bacterium]|nr:HAMP domain-containing sensor histidine kinase [Terriglobales bacterium]
MRNLLHASGARILRATTAKRVLVIISLFVMILSAVFCIAQIRVDILAGVRAYVAGEGLWSKGHKESVNALLRYAATRDRSVYLQFERSIEVLLGDRVARIELEKSEPDVAIAERGFLQGGNHPDDVPKLILLFRRFRNLAHVDRAVDIWARADTPLLQLLAVAERIDRELSSPAQSAGELEPLLAQLHEIDLELTELENEFSATLGALSRNADRLLEGLVRVAALLLLIVGLSLSWLVLRRIAYAETRSDEERRTWAALARLPRELIGAQQTPPLLERLSARASDLFSADVSVAYLRDGGDGTLRPVAAHGLTVAEWERLQLAAIPPDTARMMLRGLRRDDVVVRSTPDTCSQPLQALGAMHQLSFALRHGDHVCGLVELGFRVPAQAELSPAQHRLARGISQTGSLVLRNIELIEALERANRSRADFVGNVSHELRTPLHVIIGYADLLREEQLGGLNAEQLDAVERCARCSRELLDLVTATLNLSRLERPDITLELQTVDIADLLAELVAEVEKVPRRSEVGLAWHAEGDLALRTDPLKLRMVLKNLIGNALKYTERGSVRVSAEPSVDAVELSVRDTGVGIPAEMLPRIFEPFEQLRSGTAQVLGGVGLGLHISRRLIDLLGGSIAVESEPGRGSTFRVR